MFGNTLNNSSYSTFQIVDKAWLYCSFVHGVQLEPTCIEQYAMALSTVPRVIMGTVITTSYTKDSNTNDSSCFLNKQSTWCIFFYQSGNYVKTRTIRLEPCKKEKNRSQYGDNNLSRKSTILFLKISNSKSLKNAACSAFTAAHFTPAAPQ